MLFFSVAERLSAFILIPYYAPEFYSFDHYGSFVGKVEVFQQVDWKYWSNKTLGRQAYIPGACIAFGFVQR